MEKSCTNSWEMLYMKKNKEKLKKENRCKTCKHQKRLFKMALWTICHTKHLILT